MFNQEATFTQPAPTDPAWTRIDLLSLALLLLASGWALLPLWQPGVPNATDLLMSVHRSFELAQGWRYGILYPRLGPDLNFGFGAPLFQFYPPLASYLGLLLHGLGLGLLAATKATMSLGLLLTGVGMYLYARLALRNRCAALVSAVLYALSPYLLLDLYERGAVAEGLALLVLPWLCWALQRLLSIGHPIQIWPAAGLVAGLMLAHNITAFWALPTVGLYFGLLALVERRYRALFQLALALGLGLALSAFYWLPALLEVKFTHAAVYMLQTPAEFAKNLVAGWDLFQPTLVFHYAGPLRFRFALLQTLVGGSGLLALLWSRGRVRVQLLLLTVLWLITLLLQMNSTLALWQNVPLLRFVQFPWRLFGLATFCTALLGGALFTWARLRPSLAWPLALTLGAGFVGANVHNLQPTLLPYWYQIDEAAVTQSDLYQRGAQGYALFSDYTPISMQVGSDSFALPRSASFPPFPGLATPPTLQVQRENPVVAQLAVQAPAPFTLRFGRIFFPGWQVYQNEQPVPTYNSGPFGLVTADLPAGDYAVRIQFEQTPLRRLADWISLIALAIGLVGWLVGWQKRLWWVGMLSVMLVFGLAFYQQTRTRPARQPIPYAVNFQDIVHLLGYELPKTTWRASEPLRVRLYWLVQQPPSTDYRLFLHLARLDDSGQVAQADSDPNLGFNPMTNWEAGTVLATDQELTTTTPIPPGRYRLLLGLYQVDPLQNLLVRSAPQVLPGDRVVLSEVEIVDE